MRPQPDQPRRPSWGERRAMRRARRGSRFVGRGRALVGGFLLVVFVLLVSLRAMAAFYTDHLWFDSLGLGSVWSQMLTTKGTLALAGAAIFFALCWGNLLIAERLAPAFRPATGDDDLIERYHEVVGHRAWVVRAGVSVFMALLIGATLGASWNEWILFTHRVDFGQKDATFHTDVGFYVFQLPFLMSAIGWLFSCLLVVLLITLLAHVVNGGIRFHTQLDRVTPQVKAHISVLLAALALVQTGSYWLGRYQLTFSHRGTVDGATYTDVNVELRAIYLLMLISLFAVGLFIANIWRRGWVLPGMAVGLWVLVAVLAGAVVPAFVQRFRVEPTESSMERQYIANNIAATRVAYGLPGAESLRAYDWTAGDISAQTLSENVGTLSNVRLWDPSTIKDSYQRKQELKPFYEIKDVDVDRYLIDKKMTEVMIAARDLSPTGIKQSSWEATHLAYTHGYGVVAAKANDKTTSGDPQLVARDIPVKEASGFPKVRPGIYFGADITGYVVVNTGRQEIDFQDVENKTKFKPYDGDDGVKVGSGLNGFIRKMAFSLRFSDLNPMVSANIHPDSKFLIERDVTSRLRAVAPFLAYDHDPYLAVVGGKAKYIVDAYTTSRTFPNAQRADTGGLDPKSGLRGRSFNYARNSVKAVIDAYDGTVTLYVVDPDDPIIRAYQKAFPDLFTSASKVPASLRDHFRYPEDLFTVQTQMWAKYHVNNPDDFYNGSDEWQIPQETGEKKKTGSSSKTTSTTPTGPDGQALTDEDRYPSQYLLMQLPGEDKESFVLLRPYVTSTDDSSDSGGQNQLRAFIVADSDPEDYGTLQTYVLPVTDLPDGPNLAAADIQADGEVGDQIKRLCQGSTVCTFAAPSIVPVGKSLLYVQSFLVAGNKSAEPKIKHVIVNYRRPGESEVAIDTSLRGALVQLFGDDVPDVIESTGDAPPDRSTTDPTDPGTKPTGTLSQQEGKLITALVKAFADADAAARKGNQVLYAEKIDQAAAIAEQLQSIREQIDAIDSTPSGTTGTTTPSSSSTTTTTTPKVTTTTSAGT